MYITNICCCRPLRKYKFSWESLKGNVLSYCDDQKVKVVCPEIMLYPMTFTGVSLLVHLT